VFKFKTPAEKETEAARAQLAKQYESEVLRPVATGQFSLEAAETGFNERHREILVDIFGEKGEPDPNLDPYEI
jgi:hypothetical protein